MYCVKCKNKTETVDVQNVVSKNNRLMLRGKCAACGCTKTQFLKKSTAGGDLVSFLTSAIFFPTNARRKILTNRRAGLYLNYLFIFTIFRSNLLVFPF